MKLYLNALLLFIAMTLPMSAQKADSSFFVSAPDSTLDFKPAQKSNSLSVNPLDALFGRVSGSYEHLFIPRHGLLIEGGYAFGNGYKITAGYRYHYFAEECESGLISPFWGFFIYKGKNSGMYEDPDTKKKYAYDLDLLTVGVHWGQRNAWGSSFFYTWRIGYGYPIVLHFDWSNGKPSDSSTIEGLAKILTGIDAELSVGFVF